MSEMTKADRIISDIESRLSNLRQYGCFGEGMVLSQEDADEIVSVLKLYKAMDARSPGSWISRHYCHGENTIDMHICSSCGYEYSYDGETGDSDEHNYCPQCGVRMRSWRGQQR